MYDIPANNQPVSKAAKPTDRQSYRSRSTAQHQHHHNHLIWDTAMTFLNPLAFIGDEMKCILHYKMFKRRWNDDVIAAADFLLLMVLVYLLVGWLTAWLAAWLIQMKWLWRWRRYIKSRDISNIMLYRWICFVYRMWLCNDGVDVFLFHSFIHNFNICESHQIMCWAS